MTEHGLPELPHGQNGYVLFSVYVWPDGDDDRDEAAAVVEHVLDLTLRKMLSDRLIRDYQLRPDELTNEQILSVLVPQYDAGEQ